VTWLRRYRALLPGERRILWHGLFLLPLSAALIRARGLATTADALRRIYGPRTGDGRAPDAQATVRIVRGVARRMRIGCLAQSAVLARMLAGRGSAVGLRLGVCKAGDGRFAAHAWVEIDGEPLGEDLELLARYSALPAPPAR